MQCLVRGGVEAHQCDGKSNELYSIGVFDSQLDQLIGIDGETLSVLRELLHHPHQGPGFPQTLAEDLYCCRRQARETNLWGLCRFERKLRTQLLNCEG